MSTADGLTQTSTTFPAMTTPQPDTSIPTGPRHPRSSRPSRRRGRGPANRDGQQQRTAPVSEPSNQPAPQIQPTQSEQQPTTAPQPGQQDQTSRSRRGGNREGKSRRQRNNGAPRRGQGQNAGPEGQEPRPEPQTRGMRARGFEAQLTRPDQAGNGPSLDSTDHDHGLRADVADFVPGMPSFAQGPSSESAPSTKGKGKARQPRAPPPKVTTKSTADDLATRIHEDISHNLYECPICCSELGRRSKIWNCELCWTVFHLSCVKKWSTNEGAAAQRASAQEDGQETVTPRAWRCPGCNLSHENFPSSYSCWCEKEIDPRPLAGLPPHSCGQTCSRPRKGCPHPCDATCHAGPCAPCTAMGPTQDCFCGLNSSSKRCQDTDYENGWSCGEICGELLPCGEHTCPLPCHEGLCGGCEVSIDARCYCGKLQTEMLCKSKDDEEDSRIVSEDGSEDEWTGCFGCGETCNRPLDCGIHSCQKNCHPQDSHPAHCPRSPDVIVNCACGKTPLSEIPGYTPRTSCEDPILNCQKPCGKTLPCGHPCEKLCHTGSCGACLKNVYIKCHCGRTNNLTICHQGHNEPPQCPRMCKATLHCGRHTCTERCCPGEQRANERQAARRKLRSHLRPAEEDIEAEHICTRICGRMLKCGRHTCPELCHKGACNTCREAVFEEIACNCGRSVLYPPQPCGAKPPACSFQCNRPKRCGHPQAVHNCHTDEENCPKCPFLTEKACLCGKRVLKNVPCWLSDARCGQICGRPLKCGSHFCRKDCHRPEDCEDATKPCSQSCGKNKTMCGHPCTDQCHAPYACPEKTPCSSKIAVTCGCGRLRQERRCNAAKAVTSKGQVQTPQRHPELTPLACDDECARLERNRSLAGALGIDINQSTTAQTITAENLPYSDETLDNYVKLAASSPLATLQGYEASLHSLAAADKSTRSFRFQPAKPALRAFAHSLAADWGFVTESHDPEPHRHVFVLKPVAWTPPLFGMGSASTIGIGGMSVRECVKLRERERSKEQEARRVAALEAKAAREAAKAQASSGDGGWAQVASKSKGGSGASSRTGTPIQNSWVSKSIYAALDGDGAKKERLVLRSGVGAGKSLRAKTPAAEVVDNWEQAEEEAEEKEEREESAGQAQDGENSVHEDPEGKSESRCPQPEVEVPQEDRPTQTETSVTDDVPV
ncbi:Zinc finger NF-X1-type [Penicillium paradoxum]|uniref:Zinc finger NF-X1-type n=1 Tax=Penicillium paradoxum TaxID=176176 RepID=UPI00254854C8|nr:Zinc finger NF-X1-type [Penicillium paradoxum]KAJ5782355.1 Zinc finger NF-X1-type [Penicillium paradoxum]